ncbi:MAG: hypothetical protein KF886_16145 [Candidatus Hydrogenedentes bacterium]|nr:hypothetical protein [Candidatus Hydrogenedentota bacterium]
MAPGVEDEVGRPQAGVRDSSSEDSKSPLRERVAHRAVSLDEPESLYDLKRAIERCFGLKFASEGLPEHCAGATEREAPPGPFAIHKGERFDAAIARLEAASGGRWLFEEIHGVPVLRPNSTLEGHGNLLDTVVTVDIKATSVWEAVSALARAVNEANAVPRSDRRPLLITFGGVDVLMRPADVLTGETPIAVSRDAAPAREVLCDILMQAAGTMQVDGHIQYLYHCNERGRKLILDYVTINAFNEDNMVINSQMGDDFERLLKTKDWMSTEKTMAVQVPGYDADDE